MRRASRGLFDWPLSAGESVGRVVFAGFAAVGSS